MNGNKMGEVFCFLVFNRAARSASPPGQRLRANESAVAEYLELHITREERLFLDGFFEVQGFRLKRYDAYEMPGLAKDSYVYLLLRTGLGTPSIWASSDEVVEIIRCKHESKPEPKDHARVWLALLWFSLLELLYPRINRGFLEVSEYHKARFTKDDLAEVVRDAVERQRQLENAPSSPIREIILRNTSLQLSRRVPGFISYLQKIGHLLEVEPAVYQQTLLFSAEIGVSLEEGMNLLLPEEESSLGDKIMAPVDPFGQVEHSFELVSSGKYAVEME
jgi:hypothetical protein